MDKKNSKWSLFLYKSPPLCLSLSKFESEANPSEFTSLIDANIPIHAHASQFVDRACKFVPNERSKLISICLFHWCSDQKLHCSSSHWLRFKFNLWNCGPMCAIWIQSTTAYPLHLYNVACACICSQMEYDKKNARMKNNGWMTVKKRNSWNVWLISKINSKLFMLWMLKYFEPFEFIISFSHWFHFFCRPTHHYASLTCIPVFMTSIVCLS